MSGHPLVHQLSRATHRRRIDHAADEPPRLNTGLQRGSHRARPGSMIVLGADPLHRIHAFLRRKAPIGERRRLPSNHIGIDPNPVSGPSSRPGAKPAFPVEDQPRARHGPIVRQYWAHGDAV